MGSGLRKHSLARAPPSLSPLATRTPPFDHGGGRCLCNSTDTAAFALIARLVPLRESGGAQPRAGSVSQDPQYPRPPPFLVGHRAEHKTRFRSDDF